MVLTVFTTYHGTRFETEHNWNTKENENNKHFGYLLLTVEEKEIDVTLALTINWNFLVASSEEVVNHHGDDTWGLVYSCLHRWI